MLSINDLSPAEQYVLKELDPEAMLVELPAGWTGNGTEDERRRAVPELRAAVAALAGRGLIDLFDFPYWPAPWHEAVPIPAAQVLSATADDEAWLRRGDRMSLLTLAVTDAGLTLWLMPGAAP
ncbi:hypothetical protein [Actinoplanes sp. NPDC049599]|uniref:hypothetical protein n=1 Tax=Actinoplanes sp. NPDC049599 TaxID=3363903 RepID=UPI0037A568B6